MFTEKISKKDHDKKVTELYLRMDEMRHDQRIEINGLKSEHALELKEKEFELKHFKDEAIKQLDTAIVEKDNKISVLSKEVEMMGKIVDINADIIDVKDLVKNLINKLPEVNLKNLTISTQAGK